jgi:hypothetical protein
MGVVVGTVGCPFRLEKEALYSSLLSVKSLALRLLRRMWKGTAEMVMKALQRMIEVRVDVMMEMGNVWMENRMRVSRL